MRSLLGLAALLPSVFLLCCSSASTLSDAQRRKCNAPLLMIVDRYREAPVDTVLTVAIRLDEAASPAMQKQLQDCGADVSTTAGTIVFVRTTSKSVPCLSSLESVVNLEFTPLTSPTL